MEIVENKGYNTECPICFEDNDLFPLSCLHLIHLDCVKNLISMDCPICSAPLSNIPEEIKTNIEENIRKYKEEMEEEERRALQEEIERRNELISSMELIIQPPPRVEILAGIQYARTLGIPLNCIPTEIKINVPEGSQAPPPGTWFQVTVGQAMERARMLMNKDSDSETESEYDSEEEDPFEKENSELEKIPRAIHTYSE